MKLNIEFDRNQFRKAVVKKLQNIDRAIVSRLMFIGEQFVADARSRGSYNDQTGNLRSSIGYLVMRAGVIVSISAFDPSGKGTDKTTGSSKGKSFIHQIADKYPSGYVLICVAGMEYAAAVESQGKNVITGSAQTAETSVKNSLRNLFKKY